MLVLVRLCLCLCAVGEIGLGGCLVRVLALYLHTPKGPLSHHHVIPSKDTRWHQL